jgi:hypothetical protein
MESVPPTAISLAGMVAVIDELETNVVTSATPLKSMVDDAVKFVPVTVIVKLFPPAVVDVGLIDAAVGTGLRMVRVCAFEVPPPGAGLTTVIEAVPAAATSAAVITAVTCVYDTKVVVLGEPLISTTEDESKPVPLTVNVNCAPPAVVDVGEMETVVGTAWPG